MTTAAAPGPDDAWLLAEAHRLLAFARGGLLPAGGFGLLDDDGSVPSPRAELYVNCRMVHAFCLGDALGEPDARGYAAAGVEAIRTRFADRAHGGWFHAIDADGRPETTKAAYDHAFVVLAGASAAMTGVEGGEDLLRQALDVVEEHFWEEDAGMVRESFSADWSEEEDYRGVNANMHTVEAFLAAYDATGDTRWRDRAGRITTRVLGWAGEHDWRIPEHFSADWRPDLEHHVDTPADPFRPYGATIGHGMEWARLCLQVAAALGSQAPAALADGAAALYGRAREDGWAPDGADGFVYTVDWSGRPVVRERMHWVVAEAIGAASVLHRVTGSAAYADDAAAWWDFARTYLVDEDRGSWHHELGPDNTPSATVWHGKPDVYHALQACLIPLVPVAPSLAAACRELRGRG